MQHTPTIVVFVGRHSADQKAEFDKAVGDYRDVLRSVAAKTSERSQVDNASSIEPEAVRGWIGSVRQLGAAELDNDLRRAFKVIDPVEYVKLVDRGLVADRRFTSANIVLSLAHEDLQSLPDVCRAILRAATEAKLDPHQLQFASVVTGSAPIEERRTLSDAVRECFRAQEPALVTSVFLLCPYYYGAVADEPDRFLPQAALRTVFILAGFERRTPSTGLTGLSKVILQDGAGSTYLVGLESYCAGNVDGAAELFLIDALWRRVAQFVTGRVVSVSELQQVVSRAVPMLSLHSDLPGNSLDAEKIMPTYRHEYVPALLNALATKSGSYSELVASLRMVRQWVQPKSHISAAGTTGTGAILLIMMLGTGSQIVLALLMCGGAFFLCFLWRFAKKGPGPKPGPESETKNEPKSDPLPSNELLARAIDELLSELPSEEPARRAGNGTGAGVRPLVFENAGFNPLRSEGARKAAEDECSAGFADVATALLFSIRDPRWRSTKIIAHATELRSGALASIRSAILRDFSEFCVSQHSRLNDWRVNMFHVALPQQAQEVFRIVPEEFSCASAEDEALVIHNSINYFYLVKA